MHDLEVRIGQWAAGVTVDQHRLRRRAGHRVDDPETFALGREVPVAVDRQRPANGTEITPPFGQ